MQQPSSNDASSGAASQATGGQPVSSSAGASTGTPIGSHGGAPSSVPTSAGGAYSTAAFSSATNGHATSAYGPPSSGLNGVPLSATPHAGAHGPFGAVPPSSQQVPAYLSSMGAGLHGLQGHPGSGGYSASTGYPSSALPLPMSHNSVGGSGGPGSPALPPGGATSYPVMGAVGGLSGFGSSGMGSGPYMPMSSPGMLGVPGGMGSLPEALAAPRAAHLAQSAAAAAGVMTTQTASGTRGAQVAVRPQLSDDLFCTCPMVCVVATNHGAPQAVPLEMLSLQFNVHCHISMAFVDVQLVCRYPSSWNDAPLVFFLPKTTDTTITELNIENMVRASVFATAVVPIDDVRKYGGKGSSGYGAGGLMDPADDATNQNPEMFLLPLPPGVPGDQYRVKLSYFHPMAFDLESGRYVLRLPTMMPQLCLPEGSSVNSVVDVSVSIDTGLDDGQVDLTVVSHPHVIRSAAKGSVSFDLDQGQVWNNEDVVAGYRVWRDTMTATVHVEAPQPDMPDQRGTFALSVTPPGPENSVSFPRSVVFMFDRSGSMTGDPIRYAKAALMTGLNMLAPQDHFTVVAFDHEQLWWTDTLIEATRQNIATCMQWVNDDLSARGTTDIKSPLQAALRLLSGATGLPFVFLLTDGCVDDERDICNMAEAVIAGGDPTCIPLVSASAHTNGLIAGIGLSNGPQPSGALSQSTAATSDGLAHQAPLSSLGSSAAGGGPPSSGPPSSGPYSSAYYSSAPSNGTGMAGVAGKAAGGRMAPRIYTFGIGPYCNHYFLKQLAAIGRGMNDVAFRPHAIQAVMERMLAAAALPMLSDVKIKVEGVTSLLLFPFPIPDVFVGQPLLVSGKFEGDWPETVTLYGLLPDGSTWEQEVPSLPANGLPLQKIFVKSHLDLMTANAWRQNNPPALVKQIIDLSVATGVASAHTAMVGFETTPDKYQQMLAVPASERRKKLVKWAIGGAAGIGIVAGVAAALTFGDLASSIANMPVGDAMAAMGGDLGGFFGGLGDFGDCCGGCDCGDCGDVCTVCVTC